MAQLCQFDEGNKLRITIVKKNAEGKLVPVVLDPGNDEVRLVLVFKSGVKKIFLMTIVDGPNGVVEYITKPNDIEEFGKVKLQLRISIDVPPAELCTRIVILTVEKKL